MKIGCKSFKINIYPIKYIPVGISPGYIDNSLNSGGKETIKLLKSNIENIEYNVSIISKCFSVIKKI